MLAHLNLAREQTSTTVLCLHKATLSAMEGHHNAVSCKIKATLINTANRRVPLSPTGDRRNRRLSTSNNKFSRHCRMKPLAV